MSAASSTNNAFFALVRTAVMFRRVMEPFFAAYGLSGAQWGILRALHASEKEGIATVRVTELSGLLLVRIPSVTVVVARLAREGLVRRDVSSDDHRVRQLSLTPAGRQLVEKVSFEHQSRVEAMLVPLSAGERSQLASLLGKVADHLDELDQTGAAAEAAAAKVKAAEAGRGA